MGNRWGAGWGNGEGMGGGGRSVYKQPGTRLDKDRTTQKGGIPSKWEGLGNKGSIKGSIKGVIKGTRQGVVPCALVLSTCTYCMYRTIV
jgi:hypothetical protein